MSEHAQNSKRLSESQEATAGFERIFDVYLRSGYTIQSRRIDKAIADAAAWPTGVRICSVQIT
jgi:hypothetical protein